MKKLPIIIASLALAVGAGVGLASNKTTSASAAEAVYKQLTFPNSGGSKVTGYTTTWTATQGTDTWSIANFNTNSNAWSSIKCGRKNAASTGTITTGSAYSEAITSVVVNVSAVTSGNVNTTYLEVCDDNSFSSSDTTYQKVTVASLVVGDNTYTITSPATSMYYRLSFDCSSASANGVISVASIKYMSEATGDSVSLNGTECALQVGGTKEVTASASGDVTWTSSDESVATVAGSGDGNSTGTITAVAVGTATITATVGTASATYDVTVYPALVHAGSFEDPFTVADVRNAIDSGCLAASKRFYVKGLFSKTQVAYSSGKTSVWIKDDLSDTDDLELYNLASVVSPNFASGDEIIASATTANIKKFNTTYEFAGCDLYNPVTNLTVTTNKTFTTVGDTLTLSNLNAVVTYKHGSTTYSGGLSSTYFTINEGSSVALSSENNEIAVKFTNSDMKYTSYQGTNTASFTLNINGLIVKTVSEITLKGSLSKTAYTTADTAWDLSGLSLTATFTTAETMDLDLDADGVTVTVDPATPVLGTDSIIVTATYEGKECEDIYEVSVVKYRKGVYVEYASYNFVGVETELSNNASLSATTALTLFQAAYQGDADTLVSVTPTGTVAYGNGTGGAFSSQGDMIKLGKSGGTGSVKLTYPSDVKIGKVVVSAHDWVSGNGTAESKIDVTGSKEGAQVPSTSGTYGELSFTLSESTNVVEIGTTAKRAFINKITVYLDVAYTANATSVFEFIDNYMHMEDVSTEEVGETGACLGASGYYALASVAYNALNAAAKELFCTNEAFSAEFARLSAWAAANGQTIDTNNNLVAASRITSSIGTGSASIMVIVVSLTCVTLLGAALILKKKHN